ncbi:dihydropteroate synthase [Halococcus hamelinensis]|nr:dihydropteroate synthase [Halococcus hamelinensis]
MLDGFGIHVSTSMSSASSASGFSLTAGLEAALDSLRAGGLTDKTIIDPGFGGWFEGKTVEDDQDRFRRLAEFQQFDCPIAVATPATGSAGRSIGVR